jgi:hypothetical protein
MPTSNEAQKINSNLSKQLTTRNLTCALNINYELLKRLLYSLHKRRLLYSLHKRNTMETCTYAE